MGKGVRMVAWRRPQSSCPLDDKGVGRFFPSEFASGRSGVLLHNLQVSEFMEEKVMEHEPSNPNSRPFYDHAEQRFRVAARMASDSHAAEEHMERFPDARD